MTERSHALVSETDRALGLHRASRGSIVCGRAFGVASLRVPPGLSRLPRDGPHEMPTEGRAPSTLVVSVCPVRCAGPRMPALGLPDYVAGRHHDDDLFHVVRGLRIETFRDLSPKRLRASLRYRG